MEDNNAGFSPEDFGLDANAPSDKSATEPNGLSKFSEDSHGSRVDLSRMKMVLDVPLKVTVELGRTKLLVNDLLQLGQGSVIELDKMAGEPMEIYVNDKLVAMGEVVVVNEKFGVRLTDVMSGIDIEENPPSEAI
jgi:flagellar motor switch protein FliN/FliY